MDLSIFLSALCALFLVRIVTWLLRYAYKAWLYRKIDGPKYWPILGNSLDFNVSKSELFKMYTGMMSKHKSGRFFMYWIGTSPTIVINKSDDLDVILNDSTFMDKSFDYGFMQPWLKTGLLTAGSSKWFHRRKLITPSFHFDILKDFLSVINEQSEIFIETLRKLHKTEAVALKPLFSACSLDIVCETAMGVNVHTQTEQNSTYFQAVLKISELLMLRMRTPHLWSDFLFQFSECAKEQKKTLEILHGFTRKIINERCQDFAGISGINKKRVAFLDTLMDARLKDADSIDLDGIQEEVDTFMFEGHDTTTSALDWACFTIGTHPDVQAKLHDEIDAIFSDSKRSVTQDDLNKLTYLECAIRESLRLYPPVSFIGRTVTEDTVFCGQKLLKGTPVIIAPHVIHRDERYFPEPEEYRPERFSAEGSKHPPFAFIPFSAGKRNCIGQRFAMLQLKVMLTNLLRSYKIECNQTFEQLKAYSYLILRTENPIMVKLIERQ